MPDGRGLEVVHALRSADPAVPILVLTGVFTEDLGQLAVREGADDYLVKSQLTPGNVRRALTFAVERRQTMTRLARAQQLEMVGRLAASVAHDFNNLLTVVRGTAASIRHSGENSETIEKTLEIERAVLSGSRLTRHHACTLQVFKADGTLQAEHDYAS